MPVRYFAWNGLRVAVDGQPQVLHLKMDPFASWGEIRRGAVGRRRAEGGIQVIEFDPEERFEAPLYPSIAAMPDCGPFASAAVLARKAKAVDDGIVAALELLLDEGTDRLLGRAALLDDVQARLRAEWDRSPEDAGHAGAIGLVAAARTLGGDNAGEDPTTWPSKLRLMRGRFLAGFRGRQDVDVPMGVYSWSPRLEVLYRQGKALQEPLPPEVASALAHAMGCDEALRGAYESHLALLALTNPLVRPGVLHESDDDMVQESALLPASETPEGVLLKRLVGTNPVPPGFDLIGELIDRILDGRLGLSIDGESGWYDHVLHALEPLLLPDRTPESGKLRLAEDYRDDLKALFRSLLGSARETHVKQIESPVAGGCPLVVRPHLSFEPLAEHYRRRAASYRFVRERLVALLGEDVLLSRSRLTPRGEEGGPLLDELITMEQLYTGAWAVVLDDLGLAPEGAGIDGRWLLSCKAAARSWASMHRNDPDLAEDVRMMVPLFRDAGRDEFHVLAIVGYEQRNLRVSFTEHPAVSVRDARGRAVEPDVDWYDSSYALARPVTITCRTKRLLDRAQFQALCDREVTAAAIRAALSR